MTTIGFITSVAIGVLPIVAIVAAVVLRHRVKSGSKLMVLVLVVTAPIAIGILVGSRWWEWKSYDVHTRNHIERLLADGAVFTSGRLEVDDEFSTVKLDYPKGHPQYETSWMIRLFPLKLSPEDHIGGGLFVAGFSALCAGGCWMILRRRRRATKDA